jgi:hypothetical protein
MAQEQQKQQLEREDPAPRITVGSAATIKDRRNDRVYMLANPNDVLFGVSGAENDGWRFIDRNSDKERILGGKPGADNSAHETWLGQILMWKSRSDYAAQQEAKEKQDAEVKRQIESPGGIDGVRNLEGELAFQRPERRN